jgi:nucleoid DNA-binding protein
MAKAATAGGKPMTKSEILASMADATQLTRKQVSVVFDALAAEMKKALGKKGPGLFVVPGLMKVTKVHKPAVPAKMGINPFTKQQQMFKAKPARSVVKVKALKNLKEMVK